MSSRSSACGVLHAARCLHVCLFMTRGRICMCYFKGSFETTVFLTPRVLVSLYNQTEFFRRLYVAKFFWLWLCSSGHTRQVSNISGSVCLIVTAGAHGTSVITGLARLGVSVGDSQQVSGPRGYVPVGHRPLGSEVRASMGGNPSGWAPLHVASVRKPPHTPLTIPVAQGASGETC